MLSNVRLYRMSGAETPELSQQEVVRKCSILLSVLTNKFQDFLRKNTLAVVVDVIKMLNNCRIQRLNSYRREKIEKQKSPAVCSSSSSEVNEERVSEPQLSDRFDQTDTESSPRTYSDLLSHLPSSSDSSAKSSAPPSSVGSITDGTENFINRNRRTLKNMMKCIGSQKIDRKLTAEEIQSLIQEVEVLEHDTVHLFKLTRMLELKDRTFKHCYEIEEIDPDEAKAIFPELETLESGGEESEEE